MYSLVWAAGRVKLLPVIDTRVDPCFVTYHRSTQVTPRARQQTLAEQDEAGALLVSVQQQ
jgi:hypothetical protein